MTTNIQLLRSSIAQKRPQPTSLLDGQPAVNTNVSEPGLFFKATDGSLFKVGPVAITSTGNAPNASAAGVTGNTPGETWLDNRTTFDSPVLKVYNGSQWVSSSGFQVNNGSGDFQLNKTLTVRTLIVNGTGPNAYIRFPNAPSSAEATLPTAPGIVYFNTTTNSFRQYDGTNWTDLSGGNIQGELNVSGGANIGENLTVLGSTILGNDSTIDTLTINSEATFTGDVIVGTDSADLMSVYSSTVFRAPTSHVDQTPARFYAGGLTSSNYVALSAPASIAANVTWTLPNTDGSAGQVLTTNGAGSLSWSSGANRPIQEFLSNVETNYTITLGNNAMSVGTLIVEPGVTVTVPAGSRWVVL